MNYGSAHVAGLYTVPNGSGTQFHDGAEAIWNLGLRTFKCYLTPAYATDYPLETWSAAPATLTELAQTTEVATELARAWDTVVFTAFTFANGITNWWRSNASAAKLAAEYTEYKALAVHLLTTYNGSGKRFILSTWEGDWAFMDSTTVDTAVDRALVDQYAAFLAVRQRAVQDARAETAHAGVTVLNAFEVNRVLDAVNYPHRRRILRDIASRLTPDMVSYSAYDSTIVDQGGWGADTAAWEAATTPAFTKAIKNIKAAFPGVPVYIGEFGFPENEATNDHPDNNIGDMIQVVNDVCVEQGVDSLLFWEVFDNEASVPYTYRGYWLLKPNGDESLSATKLQELI
jgi:hypothetical protein